MQAFFDLVDSRKWTLKLPPGAHQLHDELRMHGMHKRLLNDIEGEGVNTPRQTKRFRREDMEDELHRRNHILKDLVNHG